MILSNLPALDISKNMIMKKKFSLLFLYILFVGNSFSQSINVLADSCFKIQSYAKAASYYTTLSAENPSKYVFFQLGRAYDYQRLFEKALTAYTRGLEFGDLSAEEKDLYFNALKKNRKYEDARYFVKKNYPVAKKNQLLESIDSVEKWSEMRPKYIVNILELNSTSNDFALSNFAKGQYIFSSDRGEASDKNKTFEYNNKPFLDVYTVSKKDVEAQIGDVEKLNLNEAMYHEGSTFYDMNNNLLYLTKNYVKKNDLVGNKEKISKLKIVIMSLSDTSTVTSSEDFEYNNPNYSVGHPCLSRDGNRLYFVSDMPGGLGGTDLYYCEKIDGKKWGKPVNLGPTINTIRNEMFPYLSFKNELIFASEGHIGFGGLDLFVSKMDNGNFQEPKNMGNTLNSSFDDFSLIYKNEKQDYGFFTSNRLEGKGLDDIYQFELKDKEPIAEDKPKFRIIVRDEETKETISNVSLRLFDIDMDVPAFLTTQEKGMVDAVVNPKHHYTLVAEKEGYIKTSFNDLDPSQKTYTAFLNKKTMNKAIEIKNIYYEFNKAAIVENAKPNLEKLVFILTENPELIIELGSHTDSRGSDDYNRELSQKRAEAVVQYLVNSGISQKRMVAKGYGESQLANNCTNTAICSEEDHAKNRRTEFKIIGIDNAVISSKVDQKLLENVTLTNNAVHIPTTVINKPLEVPNGMIDVGNYTIQIGAFSQPNSKYDQSNTTGKYIKYVETAPGKYAAYLGNFMTEKETRNYIEKIKNDFPGCFLKKLR
jgi:outer membrane protein OmpA-like peptidoglycan-associated protein